MDSDVTQSAFFYNLLGWGEAHKKQLLIGLIAVVVVGLGVAFYFVHEGQVQDDANDALSKLLIRTSATAAEPTPDAFLKVASDYPNTDAGQRALILGASGLFTEGKYDEARGEFQKFLQEHAGSPFTAQAALGVASCLEAQGKIDEAVSGYRNVSEHYQDANVVPQAKVALARLLEKQGKLQEARDQLEPIARTYPPARDEIEQLLMAHPELIPTSPEPTMSRTAPTALTNRPPMVPALSNRPTAAPTASGQPTITFAPTNKPPVSSTVSNKP